LSADSGPRPLVGPDWATLSKRFLGYPTGTVLVDPLGSTIRDLMYLQNPCENSRQAHRNCRFLPYSGTRVVGNQWFARQRDLHGIVHSRVRTNNRQQFEQGPVLPDAKANSVACYEQPGFDPGKDRLAQSQRCTHNSPLFE